MEVLSLSMRFRMEDTSIAFRYYNLVMQKEGDQDTPLSYQFYIQTHRQRLALRDTNFNHTGPPMEQRVRSAQIKAINKFLGRLRSDNKNYEAILQEMDSLNLSKYLQEISAIMGSCVCEKQIRFYTDIATRLHQDYEGVPAMLIKDLLKQFTLAYDSSEDNKPRLKSLLLFTTQLFVCGFPFPYRQISEMLKKLVKAGTKKRTNFTTQKELRLFAYFYNCDIYSAFLVQFGPIFTLAVPVWAQRWSKQNKQVPQYPTMIPAKTREDFTNIFFTNYINSCGGVLSAAFERIKELQGELRQNLRMSGQFNRQIEGVYNQLKEKFLFTKQQLGVIVQAVSSPLVIKEYENELVEVQEIMKKYINKIDNVEIFENEFERELYCDLPDLIKTENKAANEDQYKEFKQKLDRCKNRGQSDQVAKAFEAINCKKTRKLLVRDILEYRKEYQLVTPFLCRIASIAAVNHKDVSEWLQESLFVEYQKLRENINVNFVVNDKRSRNLKYICQFTKFKLIDPERMLTVIQNLIDDLKGFNLELLIAALESVGRFLYLAPLHANKFTFLLSKLENVMKQKSFPLFTTSQLLNSINLLKPYIELPKPQTSPPTSLEIQAEDVLSQDVLEDIGGIIKGVHQVAKTEQGRKAIERNLIKQIEHYDFLGNYNYAYLVRELGINEITDYVVGQTVKRLEEAVKTSNYQNCLLWSRFLGELYKYDLIKRSFLFDQLRYFLKQGNGQLGVINLVCTTLETCHGYLNNKRVPARNQRFLFLVEFKQYIHRCLYVPMLEQFKIIDVLDELQPNLTSIKPEVLSAFLLQIDNKKDKQVDLSKLLDLYLEKRNLKDGKENQQLKDLRTVEKDTEQDQTSEQRNSEILVNEAKTFDNEFLNVMSSHIKDLSGRIAKPAFVEKVIERKRERKKVVEGEQKRTIIGRCGNKFVKKEVVFASESSKPEKEESRQE